LGDPPSPFLSESPPQADGIRALKVSMQATADKEELIFMEGTSTVSGRRKLARRQADRFGRGRIAFEAFSFAYRHAVFEQT
jgi:hypothetical protein